MQTRYQIEFDLLTPWGEPIILFVYGDELGIQIVDEGIYSEFIHHFQEKNRIESIAMLFQSGIHVTPDGLYGRFPLVLSYIIEHPESLQLIAETIQRAIWCGDMQIDQDIS